MKKLTALLLTGTIMLSACADKADKIQASYVSPLQYQDLSCKQVRGEIARVSRKMNEVAGVQDKTASDDSVAMGVGLVLFLPALFFIDSSDHRVELGRLKGEFDALEQVAIQKNCDVAGEINNARAMEAERRKKNETNNGSKKQYN
jgi:hypothetical protein